MDMNLMGHLIMTQFKVWVFQVKKTMCLDIQQPEKVSTAIKPE